MKLLRKKLLFTLSLFAIMSVSVSVSAMDRDIARDVSDIRAVVRTIDGDEVQGKPENTDTPQNLEVGTLSVLPKDVLRLLISLSDSELNLRITCKGFKSLVDGCIQRDVLELRHPSYVRIDTLDKNVDTLDKNERYEKEKDSYLVSLQSLLACAKPRTISCCFISFEQREQIAVVASPGLRFIKTDSLRNDVIPFMSASIEALLLQGFCYANIPFFKPDNYTLPHLSFTHLPQLQFLSILTDRPTRQFELNMALLPTSLRTLYITNRDNSSALDTLYRLGNCQSLQNLTSLQTLSFCTYDKRLNPNGCLFNNFSDLTVLPVSLTSLDLRHCPNIVDFTPLQGLTMLRKLIVSEAQQHHLPQLPKTVVVLNGVSDKNTNN